MHPTLEGQIARQRSDDLLRRAEAARMARAARAARRRARRAGLKRWVRERAA